MSHVPRIILLNGVGSVGKSSTARALQRITHEPFLHVAMDAFVDMLPPQFMGHPDGLVFEVSDEDGNPSVAVRSGIVLDRAMAGMRHAVAAMAAQGNNLIVDDVMIGPAKPSHYRDLLSMYELRWIGLFASLVVLEQREAVRGDRVVGLARWQYDRVHRDIDYDLKIDTTAATPEGNARRIRDAFDL